MIDEKNLLYVEPKSMPLGTPVIDRYTKKMAAAIRKAKGGIESRAGFQEGSGYRGFHICVCHAVSSNMEHLLENGEITNSLCVHYLALHRPEVTAEQLARVDALPNEQVEPTYMEIWGHERESQRMVGAARGERRLRGG